MSDNKALPLKLKTDGALQQINAAEKNFVSYLAGQQLGSADSSDVGLLTTSASGNRLVGSLTDTYYPEPVGTHPYDQQSVISTTTNLYQINGTALENDSDWRKPLGQFEGNIYEMSEQDLDIFADDINGRIVTSDYPGAMRLSATQPSADWKILVPSILTDQRADSAGNPFTVNDYSVWLRTTMTAPTEIKDDANNKSSIVGIKRSNGDSGDYQGLQKLTDRQIQVTIGQRAKTRRSIDGNVGSFQLRTSVEGTPTDAGTWVSRGSASNTIRLVHEQNYTRTRNSLYTRARSSAYTRNRVTDFTGEFIGDYIGNYSRNFAGNYSRTRVSNYIGDFTGDYTRDFVGDYSRTSVRTSTRTRVSTFSRTRNSAYTQNSTRTRVSNYAGNFVGDYSRSFAGDYVATYVGNYSRSFVGDYIGTTLDSGTEVIETYTLYVRTA